MADQISDAMAQLEEQIEAAAKGLILEVTANLIEATPVDTGHARANWVPGIEPYDGEAGDSSAHDAGVAAVLRFKVGDREMSIVNNVPYIPYLIAGSSAQAPAGWDVAAIDAAVATVQAQYDGLDIDVTR